MNRHFFLKTSLYSSIAILFVVLTIRTLAAPVLLPDLVVDDIKLLPQIEDEQGYTLYPVEVTYKNVGNKRAYLSMSREKYDPPQLVRDYAGDEADFNYVAQDTYDVPEPPVTYLNPGQTFVRTGYISPSVTGHVTIRATIDYKNDVHEITESNNTKVERFFVRLVEHDGALIKDLVSEDTGCGDSSGNDGIFRACKKDTITHLLSGITAKVIEYDSRQARLYLTGADRAYFYIDKGGFRTVTTKDGHKVKFKYDRNSGDNIFIEVIMEPQELEDTSDCTDPSGDDGEYALCPGSVLTHDVTEMDITAGYYNDEYLTLNSIDFDDQKYIVLYKNIPARFLLKNGYQVDFEYTGINRDSLALLDITSEAPATCGDVSGDDGEYAICKGDTITHQTSETTFELIRHVEKDDADYAYFIVRNPDAGLVRIKEGESTVFMSENGYEVTFNYIKGLEGHGYYFEISSEYSRSLMDCGNMSGIDGLFHGCIADKLTYEPAGVVITVISYDDEYAEFLLEGAGDPINAVLPKGEPLELNLEDGYTMSIVYTDNTRDEGAFVEIYSDIPNSGGDTTGDVIFDIVPDSDDKYIDPDMG